MGTNFYARVNTCEHCNKPDYELHIGKQSIGWQFGFRGYVNYQPIDGVELNLDSWQKWKSFLNHKTVRIVDEYGEEVKFSEFAKFVEASQLGCKLNHAYCVLHPEECPEGGFEHLDREYIDKHWLDRDGYGFSDWVFC
jgi:hypothetical protein